MNVGDHVKVTYKDESWRTGVITEVDTADEAIPHRVLFDDVAADAGYPVWVGVGFADVEGITKI